MRGIREIQPTGAPVGSGMAPAASGMTMDRMRKQTTESSTLTRLLRGPLDNADILAACSGIECRQTKRKGQPLWDTFTDRHTRSRYLTELKSPSERGSCSPDGSMDAAGNEPRE